MYLDIPIINNYNINDFKEINYPVVIKNGCNDMSALKNWNYKYLQKNFKNNKFKVQFFEKLEHSETTNTSYISEGTYRDVLRNLYIKNTNIYLAGFPLEIYKNKISDNIFNDIKSKMDKFRKPELHILFIGKNAKSGCHLHVEDDYVLHQIFGTKTVYLCDYHDNNFELNNFFSFRNNFITKNFFKLNHKLYKIYKVTLFPGNTLLIPPWWFHAVQNNGLSCSISNIYYRPNNNYIIDKPLLLIRSTYFKKKVFYIIIILILYLLYIYKYK
jgi:hypothetical protein